MCDTYTAVDEEVGNTRESQEPIEKRSAAGTLVGKRQQAQNQLQNDCWNRPSLLVHIRQEFGRHSIHSEGLNSTSGSIGGRVGNTDDRDSDNGVEDGRQHFDTSKLDGINERRSLGVSTAGPEEDIAIGRDDETQDEQVDNVEEADSPENLFGSLGDLRAGIFGLRCGQTCEFSSSKREGSSDEDRAEALEAIAESLVRAVPILSADVATVVGGNTAAVDDYAEDDKACAGETLDQRENKLD